MFAKVPVYRYSKQKVSSLLPKDQYTGILNKKMSPMFAKVPVYRYSKQKVSSLLPKDQYTGVTVYLAPLDSLPPRGASCPGISCPPPWLSSPPGGKLSRPVYLAPRQQVKIYVRYFVIFLYHLNEFRSYTSLKVRNWCLWG